jgi:peptidoglycan/xylan/chitin deacetylase (PgdA/CDA1 family)
MVRRVAFLVFVSLAALDGFAYGVEGPSGPDTLTFDRGAIVRGPRDTRRLAIVFTADQYAEGAGPILDALHHRRVHASFFLTGRFLRLPEAAVLVGRLRREGHLVGPHSDAHLQYATWDRPPRLLVTREVFEADLAANLRMLSKHGIEPQAVRFFLPPFEHYTEEIASWTGQGGRILINLTPGTRSQTDYMTDDDPHFTPAREIVASVLKAERTDPDGLNGYILLMHLGAGPGRTRDHLHDHLAELLDELVQRGYGLIRVDELLADRRQEPRP